MEYWNDIRKIVMKIIVWILQDINDKLSWTEKTIFGGEAPSAGQ